MERKDFIAKYYPYIQSKFGQYRIYPELVIAQAIVESSDSKGKFGNNYNARVANNYFGIKADSRWKGATVNNPEVKTEANKFRRYASIEESIEDYLKFLNNNKRYKDAGLFMAMNYGQQAQALQKAGYAGKSTTYAKLITNVADSVKKIVNSLGGKFVEAVKENKAAVSIGGGAILLGALAVYMVLKSKRNGRK